jgi:hypothetical protein
MAGLTKRRAAEADLYGLVMTWWRHIITGQDNTVSIGRVLGLIVFALFVILVPVAAMLTLIKAGCPPASGVCCSTSSPSTCLPCCSRLRAWSASPPQRSARAASVSTGRQSMSLIEEAAETAVTVVAPELAIPARIIAWIRANGWRLLLIAAGVVAALTAILFVVNMLTGGKRARVENKLDAGMAAAAQSNAADAVTVVQERATSEHTIERTVIHAQAAVQAATDTSGADAAGRAGLCAISASLCPASGVQ